MQFYAVVPQSAGLLADGKRGCTILAELLTVEKLRSEGESMHIPAIDARLSNNVPQSQHLQEIAALSVFCFQAVKYFSHIPSISHFAELSNEKRRHFCRR